MNNQQSMNEDQLPNLLGGLKKKGDGFTSPPPTYFAELAAKVVQQEQLAEQPTAPKRGRIRQLVPVLMAMAAALLLLVWFKPWAATNELGTTGNELAVTETELNEALASLTDEDILSYITENIADFELETLTNE